MRQGGGFRIWTKSHIGMSYGSINQDVSIIQRLGCQEFGSWFISESIEWNQYINVTRMVVLHLKTGQSCVGMGEMMEESYREITLNLIDNQFRIGWVLLVALLHSNPNFMLVRTFLVLTMSLSELNQNLNSEFGWKYMPPLKCKTGDTFSKPSCLVWLFNQPPLTYPPPSEIRVEWPALLRETNG